MLFTSKKFKFSDLNFGPENDGGSWEGGGGVDWGPPAPNPPPRNFCSPEVWAPQKSYQSQLSKRLAVEQASFLKRE